MTPLRSTGSLVRYASNASSTRATTSGEVGCLERDRREVPRLPKALHEPAGAQPGRPGSRNETRGPRHTRSILDIARPRLTNTRPRTLRNSRLPGRHFRKQGRRRVGAEVKQRRSVAPVGSGRKPGAFSSESVARAQSSPGWIILRRSHRSRWAAPKRDAQNAFVVLNRRRNPGIVIADVELSRIVSGRLKVNLML